MWVEEAPKKTCTSKTQRSVINQKECQTLCEADAGCVGIGYSHKYGYRHICYICKDDKMTTNTYTNYGLGFYRRQQGNNQTSSNAI